MKRLLLLALCSGSYCEAFAKDSDWKLCKDDVVVSGENSKLVVNAYEHRTSNGRAADLTLIYGGNVLRGNLDTSESTSGVVKLKGDNSLFKGTAAIDYQTGAISLVGKLTLNKVVSDLNAGLACETLSN
ncbi:hypothetical protein SHI21_06285 [Bacteriovorax sp. PP10]|uniref:Uncharacterized protein n=1 Tax=Bacteriovorax antarcticus TaxID=3088717 RepID=A0ABU5VRV9_9BACT|nr:hypothetical protein [Bacteriovorax sp. PP10]MEA9355798.1 hypothetical protein [Bacteriovorax sp. PP10]